MPVERTDSTKTSFVALPYAFYAPETNLAFGAGVFYSYLQTGSRVGGRPATVKSSFTYTLNNQLLFVLWPELYFDDERYFFEAYLNYFKYPSQFYGIGNNANDEFEDYTPTIYRAWLNGMRRVLPGLYVGAKFQYEYTRIDESEDPAENPMAILRNGTLAGSEPNHIAGLGASIEYDTRDNLNYPLGGRYYQLSAIFHDGAFGSDYAFNSFYVDLREYLQLTGDHVIALQAVCSLKTGDVPFHQQSLFGGQFLMRGYLQGRFRDDQMVAVQGEYRMPLWKRLKLVTLVGAGEVADSYGNLQLSRLKAAAGIGLRYLFSAKDRIHLRVDFAFLGGQFGPYANVLESF
ncbi:MAG: BamA/TamA family outer membrane protein [Calditrichia bacterium]